MTEFIEEKKRGIKADFIFSIYYNSCTYSIKTVRSVCCLSAYIFILSSDSYVFFPRNINSSFI